MQDPKTCTHIRQTDVEQNPYRFYCLDCGEYFADYGDGKGPVFAWTLASPARRKVHQGMVKTIVIDHIRGGQPRAYADHEYESIITFSVPEGQLWGRSMRYTRDQVIPYVKLLVSGFSDNPDWFESRLDTLEELAPNKWRAIVKTPYID